MRLMPTPIIAGLVIAWCAAALPCPAAGIALDIAPAALVKGPEVNLGDIAAVRCDDPDTAAELEGITIGSAPMPGKSRRMDATYIKVRLRQHGFDPEAVETEWPDAVVVTTRSIVIPGADLAAAGKEAVLAQLAAADAETIVTCSRVPADMVLPDGALDLQAEPLGAFVGTTRLVKVTAVVDGQRCSSQTICYDIQRFADVFVVGKQIDRGQVIAQDDVALERRDISSMGGTAPYDNADDLVGLRARRTLRPGDVISDSCVEKPPVVERGEKVWVTVVCGSIRISAEAIACEDAPAGATVRLKSASSGETFVAHIDDEGRVFVTP